MICNYLNHLCLYLSVCTVCEAQVLYDGIYSAVFFCDGVMLRVETNVCTEQQILPHSQRAHEDIILETHGLWRHKDDVRRNQSKEFKAYNVKGKKPVYVYICLPEPRRQS